MATGRTIYINPDEKIFITVTPVHTTGEVGTVDLGALTVTSTGPSTETAVDDSHFYIVAGTNPGTSTLYEVNADVTYPIAGAETVTEYIQLVVNGVEAAESLSFSTMTLPAAEPA